MPLPVRSLRLTATRSSRGYDVDAATYIRSVENADGQTLEPAVKAAINAFVLGCKADGIWTAIKASCVLMGARTLSGALTPLVGSSPTNNNFVSGDYDRKTGLVGNGSTKYLNTNRANNADGQDDHHQSVYLFSTSVTASRSFMGAGGSPPGSTSFGTGNPLPAGFLRSRSSFSQPTTLGAGFNGSSRSSSSTVSFRGAGTTSSIALASSGNASGNTFVFARENGSGSAETYTDARLSFYSIGSSLTLSLLDSRVSTLYTAIGAAIP
jgi:hypothetical protein